MNKHMSDWGGGLVSMTTIERPDLSLGDMVVCSAYIKPSGNHFEIENGDGGKALLWEKGATEGKEVEGYEGEGYDTCDKYERKEALFTGVFVGTTTLRTELFCDWCKPPYGPSGFQCRSITPRQFAIVYYAANKKRLVPIDCVRKAG